MTTAIRCRECSRLRKELRDLTETVGRAIAAIDAEMKLPSTVERGEHMGKITGVLELANDSARHFSLNLTFATINKIKRQDKTHAEKATGKTDLPHWQRVYSTIPGPNDPEETE